MAKTSVNLDRQADARVFSFGGTGAGTDALVTVNKGTAAATTVVLDVKGSQNIAGDLNLTGNLNITGSVNEQSVTNLAVVDINITLNKGGTTAGAAGGGILVEGDAAAVIAKLLYDGSLASKWKLGDGSSQAEIVTVSNTQTLTNKTLTTPAISSPTGLVKGDVGLGNVDNTSDVNKPVSSATTTQLNLKAANGANTDITSVLLNQTGLVVKSAAAFALTIKPNETLTAARILNIVTGDVTRSLTFTADATIGGTHSGTSSGTNTGDQTISDATIGLSDITTGNFTTTRHGFVPKGTNVGNFLKDDGTWAAPTVATYFRSTAVSGTQDGSNKVFTIGNAVSSGSEMVLVNGVTLNPGSSNDYVISGTTVTFQAAFTAPASTDVIRVYGNF